MKIAQVLSLLLDYPTETLQEAQAELEQIVADSPLSATAKQALLQFVQEQCAMDLMDWQVQYNNLFERGRSLSLLLFEHLHGESRDRGQAMVDLMKQYTEAGLEIGVRELPDFIPLYLEFLSTQGAENLKLGIQETAHILAVLTARLEQRESGYASVFHALLDLGQVDIDLEDVHRQIKNEQRDDTKEALDKVWEEEMVTFGPSADNDACSSGISRPSESQRKDQYIPIDWADKLDRSLSTEQRG